MKVLVCGGRDYMDVERLNSILDSVHEARPITEIVHGGARGADSLAGQWARHHAIKETVYPADWKKYPVAAGPIRNRIMLAESKPDLVIAFPGGNGTRHMVGLVEKAGVPCHKVVG